MASEFITLPSFATHADGAEHFFGTRLSAIPVTPGRASAHRTEQQDHRAPVILSVKQVHGTDALVVDRPVEQGELFEGGWDALVTNQPGLMVTVRTADCVPVLLHDPVRQVVAAIHAGWRGAVAGIVPKTVALLASRFGTVPKDVRMAIGPSAGACCYEVDEPVLTRLRDVFPEWQSVVSPVNPQKAHLNLRAFVRRQAMHEGLEGERIATVEACTICQPDEFFSYRREGVVKATMVSGIALVSSR
ncbi:MAG TPA: peptidoglycan editing factor PgeF [Nitrospira sp.]|nr:peptidoglycan editing factor PgeF [Nitrospira sp.]MBX3372176.1 peptidoglycan editing factor PgeF [Nitrospira sp.]HMU31458.1 peptidoglycan editing factor PgeF [Nitrospira sp.]HMX91550.1 peptidoglycan editing factor PgeF [Nitrospira sp.]HMZ97283.1 peptidoglycan editing factor PgeF [Nitrospira sp.]